jgi:DNA repair exonuclease SbcCD ATPase subunit
MSILLEAGAKNFLSYKNLVLNLVKFPLVQLVGVNGAGKTNLVSILTEALYGKNLRGYSKGELVNRNNPLLAFEIYVKFKEGDDLYVATTARRKDKAEVTLTKNGSSITAHTSKGTFQLIEQILGMDYELFMQYIYQSSKFSTEFLTATPATRKAFLTKMLELDQINNDILKVSDFIKAVSTTLTRLDTEVKTINNTLKSVNYLESLPKVFDKGERIAELTSEIEELRIKERMAAQNAIKKMEYQSDVKNRSATVLSLNTHKPKPPAALTVEKIQYDTKAYYLVKESISNVNTMFKAETLKCNTLKRKHADLLIKIPESSCSKCGHDLDNDHAIEVHAAEVEKAYNDYILQNNICADHADELQRLSAEEKVLAKEYNAYMANESIIKQHTENTIRYNNETSLWESKLVYATTELDKANTTLANFVAEDIKYTNVKDLEAELATLQQEKACIELNNSIGKVFVDSTNKLSTLKLDWIKESNDFDTSQLLLKALKVVLSKTIENGIKNLEYKTNVYLRAFGGDIRILFESNDAKLDISVIISGVSVSYYTLSTGQMARVSIATLLAMRELLNTRSSKSINLLILDEVVGTLDSEGKEQLIDILAERKDMNIFLVSHDWTHPLLEVLQVNKDKKGDTTYD